jgi:type I restriction enzyme S subunit
MNDLPPIDLTQQAWEIVHRILQTEVPEFAVRAFGSRVRGNAKPYSDLDLVIMTDQPLSFARMAALNEAFDESDLPIRVDVVDWAATSPAFQKIIFDNNCLLQAPLNGI